ncbi:hypothetical protein [Brevibacillus porteri]|uniref:hypothetical protein n=1 Tax=Brevibacillus porteri TaxID=2126350 RepID=UPI00363AC2F0
MREVAAKKVSPEGTGNVPPVIKIFNISEEALDHDNIGDFTKNPRTGAIQKMSGGGHGQDNIDFLEQNGIEYNIETTFPNGVRVGVIKTNGEIGTVFPDNSMQP